MVDPRDVEERERAPQPLGPPGVAAALQRRPVVERVAPQLPAVAVGIGRRARDLAGAKQLRPREVIGAAGRDVDRDVADQPDPALARILRAARSTRGRSGPGRRRPGGRPPRAPSRRSRTPRGRGTRRSRRRTRAPPGRRAGRARRRRRTAPCTVIEPGRAGRAAASATTTGRPPRASRRSDMRRRRAALRGGWSDAAAHPPFCLIAVRSRYEVSESERVLGNALPEDCETAASPYPDRAAGADDRLRPLSLEADRRRRRRGQRRHLRRRARRPARRRAVLRAGLEAVDGEPDGAHRRAHRRRPLGGRVRGRSPRPLHVDDRGLGGRVRELARGAEPQARRRPGGSHAASCRRAWSCSSRPPRAPRAPTASASSARSSTCARTRRTPRSRSTPALRGDRALPRPQRRDDDGPQAARRRRPGAGALRDVVRALSALVGRAEGRHRAASRAGPPGLRRPLPAAGPPDRPDEPQGRQQQPRGRTRRSRLAVGDRRRERRAHRAASRSRDDGRLRRARPRRRTRRASRSRWTSRSSAPPTTRG